MEDCEQFDDSVMLANVDFRFRVDACDWDSSSEATDWFRVTSVWGWSSTEDTDELDAEDTEVLLDNF